MMDGELQRRCDNWLRELDYLQQATDAGAAYLPICRGDDPASGAVALALGDRGIGQTLHAGWLCVLTGQPGQTMYHREE